MQNLTKMFPLFSSNGEISLWLWKRKSNGLLDVWHDLSTKFSVLFDIQKVGN